MNTTPSTAQIWQDRENAIVNSIMSANNACATLKKLTEQALAGDPKPLDEFVRTRVRATLAVCAAEAGQVTGDWKTASADNEAKRFALEFIASNLGGAVKITEPAIVEAIRKALPGREI